MRWAAWAGLLLALPVHAATDPLYPAAPCAAYWLAFDDYAQTSTFLDRDPSDRDRAAAFRAAAIRLNEGDAATVDATIARERPDMALMIEAAIYGDRISDRLQRRLLQTCNDFAAKHEETRDLR